MSFTRYLIVEDELLAQIEIQRMVKELRPDYKVVGCADSVERACEYLRCEYVDLMIVDIRLSDGLSFEIFEQYPVEIPIIFTTAYDEYALDAFRVNSIDYLLKPIGERELSNALDKYERRCCLHSTSPNYKQLETYYLSGNKKTRFLVQVGDTFRHIEISDVAFFYSEEKYTYLHKLDGTRYIVDYALDQLEKMLDEVQFFRVSRGCIANIHSINKISKHFAGRLSVQFQPECPHKIIVSRSRATDFLKWLDDV